MSSSTQQQQRDIPDLEAVWSEENPDSLCCYECGRPFGTEAVARTFSVLNQQESQDIDAPGESKCLTALGQRILFFDRHLGCMLPEKQRYVSISHVWDPGISDTQARGWHFPSAHDVDTRHRLFSSVLGIARGIAATTTQDSQRRRHEIWHDYLSVPQWQPALKARILRAIPDIFQRAECTVVFLGDIPTETIDALYHGQSTQERLAAVTRVCDAAWFKRVWTVMEFVRASRIKVMLRGHHVWDSGEDKSGDVFLGELAEVWDREANAHGASHIEDMVRLGTTLVPWNLGPLRSARSLQKLDFASAWILLSRRGCRSIHDFFYALLGLLRAKVNEQLEADPTKAVLQIVTACLELRDYSPLLMTPTDEPYPRRHEWRRMTRDGFNDVTTFGLGREASPPDLYQESSLRSDFTVVPSLKMNKIGKISFVFKAPRHPDAMGSWAQTAQTVLDFTGPDAHRFAATACCRLYHMPRDHVSRILADEERRQELETILRGWYNGEPDRNPLAEEFLSDARRVADLLHLTQPSPTHGSGVSALTFLQMHGGTIHLGWFGGFIGATCEACHETFLYRAAFYKPPAQVRNAVAYRIPGLSYEFTSRDGVGILVNDDGVIVGRLNWATPACDCLVVPQTVEVSIPDFYSVVADWRPT